MKKLGDAYLDSPLMFDTVIAVGISAGIKTLADSMNINFNRESIWALLSELISSSVSLGGFSIAALTIILTMADNYIGNGRETGFGALKKSRNFGRVLNIFKWSLVVFVAAFVYFSLLAYLDCYLGDTLFAMAVFAGLVYMVLTLARCLWLLNKMVDIYRRST
jgi:hypothetical protein